MSNPIRATWDFLRRRKIDYQLTFTSPAGQGVLHDLAKFCRANEDTYHTDPNQTHILIGRREVWLRIQKHLNLTPDQLFEIYAGRQLNPADLGDKEKDQ